MTLAPRPPYSAGQAMAAYPASASFLFQVRMRSSASGDVRGSLEPGDEIADDDGIAVVVGVPALQAGLGALADHAGGGHVPAGLAEDAVVQQYARDVLASGRGVEHLLEALVDHVAVALHGEHGAVGSHALDPGGDRRGPAVEGLDDVHIESLGEGRVAADAHDGDGLVG